MRQLEKLYTVLNAVSRFLAKFANLLRDLPLLGSLIAQL
jgi:hypothetical protein